MSEISKHKIEEGKRRLREAFPLEKVRKLPNYLNISEESYHQLMNDLDNLAVLLLESFIFIESTKAWPT